LLEISGMPSVLVVEDDTATRQLLATCLQMEGFNVQTATNGEEGLEQMRQRVPCVVLLDLMMPVMSGEQFRCAQLKDPSLARVPVVCISAMYDARERAKHIKAAACINKPFDILEVVDVVREQCR
jgi:DNA-binding response OmpR family regulator